MNEQHRQALLDRMQSIPIFTTLRMKLEHLEAGLCRMQVPYDPRYNGVFESFHGGLLMTAADSAACFAILTRTAPDQVLTTTDMNIRFLAPCLTDLTVEARLIKLGRTLCPVSIDLSDASGRAVAVAQVTYMLLPRKTRG